MKTMAIDELLAWAFVHELPKGGGVDGLVSIHSTWMSICGLGVRIDRGSSGQAMGRDHDNFFIEQGAAHNDAVVVGEAVADLAHCEVVIPEGWDPLPDWPLHDDRMAGLMADAVARAVKRVTMRPRAQCAANMVNLVVGTAILGREPIWAAPVPAIRMIQCGGKPAWFMAKQVRDVFGRVNDVEVDGFNRKAGRPHRGAYRKYEFSDDPVGDIMGRFDRELWVAALRHVHARAANQLTAHRLSNLEIPARPWGDRGPALSLVVRQAPEHRKSA